VLLMDQQRTVAVDSDGVTDTAEGELFERLIEPASLASAASPDGEPAELEYWFETEDDRTPAHRIKLVSPPAVLGATAAVVPPAYVASSSASKPQFATGALDLGTGSDQRAVAGPILAGSKVTLSVHLNKPVPVEDEASGAERRAWLGTMFPGVDPGESFDAKFDGAVWTLSWTAARACASRSRRRTPTASSRRTRRPLPLTSSRTARQRPP
jgi:hypothetical protein